jgi:hypothetical protein
MPVVALAPEMLWASIELMKNMAIGHEVNSLAQFFESLTVRDCSALSLAINSAAALGQSIVQPTTNAPNASQGPVADTRETEEGEPSPYWFMETGTASFRTTFDPMSRRRRAIIANARQASFYGMPRHPEEFQARCASRDLPFPITDGDAVALFIYASIGEQFRSEA